MPRGQQCAHALVQPHFALGLAGDKVFVACLGERFISAIGDGVLGTNAGTGSGLGYPEGLGWWMGLPQWWGGIAVRGFEVLLPDTMFRYAQTVAR